MFGFIFCCIAAFYALKNGCDFDRTIYFEAVLIPAWITAFCIRDINAYEFHYKIGIGTVLSDIIIMGGATAYLYMYVQKGFDPMLLAFEGTLPIMMTIDTLASYLDIMKLHKQYEDEQKKNRDKSSKIQAIKHERELQELRESMNAYSQEE